MTIAKPSDERRRRQTGVLQKPVRGRPQTGGGAVVASDGEQPGQLRFQAIPGDFPVPGRTTAPQSRAHAPLEVVTKNPDSRSDEQAIPSPRFRRRGDSGRSICRTTAALIDVAAQHGEVAEDQQGPSLELFVGPSGLTCGSGEGGGAAVIAVLECRQRLWEQGKDGCPGITLARANGSAWALRSATSAIWP